MIGMMLMLLLTAMGTFLIAAGLVLYEMWRGFRVAKANTCGRETGKRCVRRRTTLGVLALAWIPLMSVVPMVLLSVGMAEPAPGLARNSAHLSASHVQQGCTKQKDFSARSQHTELW